MSEQTLPEFHKWDDIPDTMATKTTLSKVHGLKLAPDQQPVGTKIKYNHRGKAVGTYDLYAIDEAIPKKKATPAQLAALEKARHMAEKLILKCSKCDRRIEGRYDWVKVTRKQWIENDYDHYTCRRCDDRAEAIQWAQDILKREDVVILDTETTDLHGEIIEIAIIDIQGETVLNQRIKPQEAISDGAYQIHGISLDDLKDCPTFPEAYPAIKQAIDGKLLVIFNASYDTTCLQRDYARHDLSEADSITMTYNCAMLWYSQYVGDYSRWHGDYRWQALPGGDHSALGDCLATLDLIKHMAQPDEIPTC